MAGQRSPLRRPLLLLLLGLCTLVRSDTVSSEAMLTTLIVTGTQYSTITAGYSLSTLMVGDCHGYTRDCSTTVVSVPILSTVPEYIASTVISTIGYTMVTSTAAEVPVATFGPGSPTTIPNAASPTTASPTPAQPLTSSTGTDATATEISNIGKSRTTSAAHTSTDGKPSSTSTGSPVSRTDSISPTTTSSQSTNPTPLSNPTSQRSSNGLTSGQKAGIAIGVLLVVAAIAALAFFIGRRTMLKGHSGAGNNNTNAAMFAMPFFLARRNRDDRDDESTTQVGSQTQLATEKNVEAGVGLGTPPARTSPTPGPSTPGPGPSSARQDLTDPEFAKAFFSRSQKG